MLGPDQVAAVVTAPFWGNSPAPLVTALRELLPLPIGRVLLVHDRRNPRTGDHAIRARDEAADRRVELVEMSTFDTALRWRGGILAALADPVVQAVFVFPGDLKSEVTNENRAGWVQMLQRAGAEVLVLGDYDSPNSFKTGFDELIGLPAVRILFPEFADRLATLNLSKLRTEFFVVGRRIFERCDQGVWSWGPDATIQLVLSVLSSPGGTIAPPVRLGTLEDEDATRQPLEQMAQVLRFVFQLAIDRMSAAKRCATHEPERAAEELKRTLAQLFDQTMKALNSDGADPRDRTT